MLGVKVRWRRRRLPPSEPVTKTPSPTRAPERVTGVTPALRPRMVTDTASFPSHDPVSPPTTGQDHGSTASFRPRNSSLRYSRPAPRGAATVATAAAGRHAIAAQSERLRFIALRPIWRGVWTEESK